MAALSIQVWAEALHNPRVGPPFRRMLSQAKAEIADILSDHQDGGYLPVEVSAAALSTVLIGILPGYILQLALLGPEAVQGTADALHALWPQPGSKTQSGGKADHSAA